MIALCCLYCCLCMLTLLPCQVYKGRRRCTGQITAMKFIVKHGKSEKDIRNLRQEIEILRQLRHENIIQMLDAFETKTDFCVVTGVAVAMTAYATCLDFWQHPFALHRSSSSRAPVS